ncbi:MAG: hypothetical protein WD750_00830 [Gammaproteobacteria bacterium]
MWVIKLGGSLQDSECLQPWLDAIAEHGRGRAVVVPGGGRFADAIREAQRRFGFDDSEAHRGAVRAMEKFAALLCDCQPQLIPVRDSEAIRGVLKDGGVPVWLPAAMVLDNPDIPESWDVTSDSIALWLAQQLQAQGLLLVKSVVVDEMKPLDELAAAGVIDAFFPELFQRQPVNLAWFVAENDKMLVQLLDYGVPQVRVEEKSLAVHPVDTN